MVGLFPCWLKLYKAVILVEKQRVQGGSYFDSIAPQLAGALLQLSWVAAIELFPQWRTV